MKKLLCIILTLTILVSIFSTSATAIIAPEDSVPLNQKENIKQRFIELYGENGILEDGVNYTWDFNQVEDTENSSNIVSPNWSSSETPNTRVTHYEIIDMANEIATDFGGPYISDEYLLLVKKICRQCDTMSLENYKPTPLHASDNYIATLKYLWTFTKTLIPIVSENITEEALRPKIHTANSAAQVGVPGTNTVAFTRLKNFIGYELKNYYSEGLNNIANQSHKLRCKYIMYGMITHLLGDLYAHRIIVPSEAVAGFKDSNVYQNLNSAIHFNPDDFMKPVIIDGKYYYPFEKLFREDGLVQCVDDETKDFSELKTFYSDNTEDQKVIAQKILNPKYVDNGQFYSYRIYEASYTISLFITYYSDGYDPGILPPMDFNLGQYWYYLGLIG